MCYWNGHTNFPRLCRLLILEWLTYFEHAVVQSFLNTPSLSNTWSWSRDNQTMYQCMGRFLDKIGESPSVSEPNRLHIETFRFVFFFHYFFEVDFIGSSKTTGIFLKKVLNFNQFFLKLNQFICNQRSVLPAPCHLMYHSIIDVLLRKVTKLGTSTLVRSRFGAKLRRRVSVTIAMHRTCTHAYTHTHTHMGSPPGSKYVCVPQSVWALSTENTFLSWHWELGTDRRSSQHFNLPFGIQMCTRCEHTLGVATHNNLTSPLSLQVWWAKDKKKKKKKKRMTWVSKYVCLMIMWS